MIWLQKGLCGISLATQTLTIGTLYVALSLFVLIYGFFIIEHPEKWIKQNLESLIEKELSESIDEWNITESSFPKSSERLHYEQLIRHIQNEGLEMILVSMITILCSGMLIMGSKHARSFWFIPWIAQQSFDLMVAVFIYLTRGFHGSAAHIFADFFAFLIYFGFNGYTIFSVMSHYILLKKMSNHSQVIINSVAGAGYTDSGVNYERLSENARAREMSEVQRPQPTSGQDPPPPAFSTLENRVTGDRDSTVTTTTTVENENNRYFSQFSI